MGIPISRRWPSIQAASRDTTKNYWIRGKDAGNVTRKKYKPSWGKITVRNRYSIKTKTNRECEYNDLKTQKN